MESYDVLIVGAGPAGLALASELGRHGLTCRLVESRPGFTQHPRATLLGARSMEFYRRLGLADEILRAGLPESYEYSVIFATRLSGHVLYHDTTPSPKDYRRMEKGEIPPTREALAAPYSKVQIGQHALEPVVLDYANSYDSTHISYGQELVDYRDTGPEVTATILDVESGGEETISAQYMVACDGGRGRTRRQLGIPLLGRGAMRRNVSYLFESDEFRDIATVGRGNLYFIFAPNTHGVFTAIDGRRTWNYQHYIYDPSVNPDHVDPETEIRRAAGVDFNFTILRKMRWSHHQSVAQSFRRGRVFLAGDSAHLFSPAGGIGMNTAIGDAFDLAWKLAGTIKGWGGPHLLDSYEAERWPIAFRNTMAGAQNADRIDAMMHHMSPRQEKSGPVGEQARAELLPRFRWLARQFNSTGLHIGYRYNDSPIIEYDDSLEPPDDPRVPIQSTRPGFRAPHAWIAPGVSTLDSFTGLGYVLVAPASADQQEIYLVRSSALELGIPVDTVTFTGNAATGLYGDDYVLVRPDGHVAWRGPEIGPGFASVWERVTGVIVEERRGLEMSWV